MPSKIKTIQSEDEFINTASQMRELIKNARNLIISSHINPDADALGSALAVKFYAEMHNVKSEIVIQDDVPFNLKFLPDSDQILKFDSRISSKIQSADTIIVVDLNDCKRLGLLGEEIIKSSAVKAVIDHHINPHTFADLYLVDTEASSTGEIIWKIFNADSDFHCSADTATALYAAIMTDTGSFRFPRTDPEVHRIVANLIECGANPVNIYDSIYNRNPLAAVRLLGKAFYNLALHNEGKIGLMQIRKEDFADTVAKEEDIENFVEKILSVEGVKIAVLIIELASSNQLRISFRSKEGYSVRELAEQFGGGGHMHAAGARVFNRDIDTVTQEILNNADELL